MAYKREDYEESESVKAAREELERQQAARPEDYQSRWDAQLNEAQDAITKRQPFAYDVTADPLYRQYKEQAIRNGKLAMQDSMGQAAALTGGYGSSYGASVGQQAYQGYMQGLNDKEPDLYALAMQKYSMEGDEAARRFELLSGREAQDYSRYRDQMGDWETDRVYAADRFDTERNLGLDTYYNNLQFDYSDWAREQDAIQAEIDWYRKMGKDVPADLLAKRDLQYTPDQEKKSSSGTGSGTTKPNITTMQAGLLAAQASAQGASDAEIKAALQKNYNVTAAQAQSAIDTSKKITLAGSGGQYASRTPR